jgi:hypothetical protein
MKTDIVNDFFFFFIEEYKFLENKTAKDIMELFSKYNVFNYITQNYPALHTMGGRAIADDIIMMIKNQNKDEL